jgi:hypothetical protein
MVSLSSWRVLATGGGCRQLARRARLDADPDHTALLAAAERAEHAALALRRAVATGPRSRCSDRGVARGGGRACRHARPPDRNPASPERASTIPHRPLSNAVTNMAAPPRPPAPKSNNPAAGPAQRPDDRVTKSHETSASAAHQPATATTADRPGYRAPGTKRRLRPHRHMASDGRTNRRSDTGRIRARTGPGKQWRAQTLELVAISGGPGALDRTRWSSSC